ncbi:MAG: tetratricopeptide repeat protein, partial [Methanothrix sp.]|nr:tetratricopeptide repeat protein [Methanothrix sp.]
MTLTGRSTLPRLSLTHIADAIESALCCLDENYKKPFIASIMTRIHSIFNKISRKSKKRNESRGELSNRGDCSQDIIDQGQKSESALAETLPAILLRNDIYDKAEETSSSIDVYWCERGLSLSDLGQFENALESYKRALEINPRSIKALKNRANVFFRIGRYEEAIDDFRKALEINPQLIDAWHGMGNAMSKLGRYKEAVSAYERTLKVNRSFIDAWVGRGVALGNMARYQEAVESFDRALEINPSLKEALYGKYLALQKIMRGEEL